MSTLTVSSAKQQQAVLQDIYDWQMLDRIYQQITDALIVKLTQRWLAEGFDSDLFVTEAQIRDSLDDEGGRFFPTPYYAPNPMNWNGLQPYIPPILHGHNRPDGAGGASGVFASPETLQLSQELAKWIEVRLHRSEGTLQRLQLLQRAKVMTDDSQRINKVVQDAFLEE